MASRGPWSPLRRLSLRTSGRRSPSTAIHTRIVAAATLAAHLSGRAAMRAAVADEPGTGRTCALVGNADEATEAALGAQTLTPDHLVANPPSVRDGVERALTSRADWVWVLDRAVIPRPEALAALVEAQARAGASAVLLAGACRDQNGRMRETR